MVGGTKLSIEAECTTCDATGIIDGIDLPEVGVACGDCHGSGMRTIKYSAFTGRRRRAGIKTVVGSLIQTLSNEDLTVESVTYDEFLAGKMPE